MRNNYCFHTRQIWLTLPLLLALPCVAQADVSLAPVQAEGATHFMSLAPVRAGLYHVKAPLQPVQNASIEDNAPPALAAKPGFITLNRNGLMPMRHVVSVPSNAAISATLAAPNKPSASNTAPGLNAKATSPTLQLFGLDNAPSENFYSALRKASAQ